ncbi:MAG: hypothetical protein NTW79_01445 [Candidatus Berkelbacteria bacterium]|nr:hypothetical protein [Candidatus Berkelbacteria bacterium]
MEEKNTEFKPSEPKRKMVIICLITVIVIAAIVAIVLHYRAKPKTETAATTTAVDPLVQFNGNYTGTSTAHQGLTDANVNVVEGVVSGTANYVSSSGLRLVLTVTGTVDAGGSIAGNLSGTGTQSGQSATVTGTYSGTIVGTTANVSYSGSGGGESASGTITLTKK